MRGILIALALVAGTLLVAAPAAAGEGGMAQECDATSHSLCDIQCGGYCSFACYTGCAWSIGFCVSGGQPGECSCSFDCTEGGGGGGGTYCIDNWNCEFGWTCQAGTCVEGWLPP